MCWLCRGASPRVPPAPSPRCVVSRAPCFVTSSRTRSGRSRTIHPRVAFAAVSRKSRRKADSVHHVVEIARSWIVSVGELNDRTRLDVAVRADVMADAGRHRAERLALVVPVRVDDRDRQPAPHPDDEPPDVQHLFGRERQLRDRVRTDWRDRCGTRRSARPSSISRRSHASVHQVVDIGLAHAGRHADQSACCGGTRPALRASCAGRSAGRGGRSLTISVPSMLISGVALPIRRSARATSSVINWPLVNIWK